MPYAYHHISMYLTTSCTCLVRSGYILALVVSGSMHLHLARSAITDQKHMPCRYKKYVRPVSRLLWLMDADDLLSRNELSAIKNRLPVIHVFRVEIEK